MARLNYAYSLQINLCIVVPGQSGYRVCDPVSKNKIIIIIIFKLK